MCGQDPAAAVADAQDPVALDGGHEPRLVADHHDEVRGLVGPHREVLQVRERDPAQLGGRLGCGRSAQDGAGDVAAVLVLLGEVAVDEHGEQPVRRGAGHAQALRGVADAQRALLLQHRRET